MQNLNPAYVQIGRQEAATILGAGLEEGLNSNKLEDVSCLAVHEAVHSFAC